MNPCPDCAKLIQQGKRLLELLDPGERERGYAFFERAMTLGSKEALGLVAVSLYFGGKVYGVTQDVPRALELARRGVVMDPPEAQCLAVLGDCYLYGVGVEKNEDFGELLLQQSIEMDCPVAMNQLGRYYQHTLNDLSLAIPLYQRAVDLDYAPAMSNLGVYYSFVAEPPQVERTLELLKRAAAHVEPYAMCGLAIFYSQESKPPQLDLARQYFEWAAALGQTQAENALLEPPFV